MSRGIHRAEALWGRRLIPAPARSGCSPRLARSLGSISNEHPQQAAVAEKAGTEFHPETKLPPAERPDNQRTFRLAADKSPRPLTAAPSGVAKRSVDTIIAGTDGSARWSTDHEAFACRRPE